MFDARHRAGRAGDRRRGRHGRRHRGVVARAPRRRRARSSPAELTEQTWLIIDQTARPPGLRLDLDDAAAVAAVLSQARTRAAARSGAARSDAARREFGGVDQHLVDDRVQPPLAVDHLGGGRARRGRSWRSPSADRRRGPSRPAPGRCWTRGRPRGRPARRRGARSRTRARPAGSTAPSASTSQARDS